MIGEDDIQEEGEYVEIPEEEEEKPGKGAGTPKAAVKPAADDDEDLDEQDPDDDDGADETDGEGDRTAVEAGDKREKRRQERREARQRRKVAIRQAKEREQAMLSRLEAQDREIAQLKQRGNSVDAYNLQQQMRDAATKFRIAERRIEEAIAKQDGAAARQAISDRDDLANHLRDLKRVADTMTGARQQTRQAPAQNGQDQQSSKPHPEMRRQYNGWRERNTWFDPELGDRDSKMAYVLDQDLEEEGYDPKTPEYWKELDSRIKQYLPHLAGNGVDRTVQRGNGNGDGKQIRRGPPVANSSSTVQNSPARKGVFVSKARVDAMKESGIWNDPERRAKQIKAYQKWDKDNGVSRGGK